MGLLRGLRRALSVASRPVRRYAGRGNAIVQPYRGYGDRHRAFLMGRVFHQPRLNPAASGNRLGYHFKALILRLFRWGYAGAEVRAGLAGHWQTVTSDGDGYFRVHWNGLDLPDGEGPWRLVDLELIDRRGREMASATAEMFIAVAPSDHVVISDIDDTVMLTGVGRKLVMMWRLFFNRSHSRVAFPGVVDFYRALYHGPSGGRCNPMIYVSRAPWSIYDVLDEFFNAHGIPGGPILFLREWGLTLQHPLPKRARDHKRDQIDHIISLFDELPVVLIGDSGQRDPEVYAEVAARHPGRIAAIYIRDVSRRGEHHARIRALSSGVGEEVDMILADSTADMAAHAARIGLIRGRRSHTKDNS